MLKSEKKKVINFELKGKLEKKNCSPEENKKSFKKTLKGK